MNLATSAEVLFSDTNIPEKDSKKDDYSYISHLLEMAKTIPDEWAPRKKYYESEALSRIIFRENPEKLKEYIKGFAYELIYYRGQHVNSVSQSILLVYTFLETSEEPSALHSGSDFRVLYEDYISHLHGAVKNKLFKKEGEKTHGLRTAQSYSLLVFRFLIFLNSLTKKHGWINDIDLNRRLPGSLAKYFTLAELRTYENQLRSTLNESKSKVIPYGVLSDTMEFLYALPPSYIKTTLIVAAHTGLRISEIRALETTCLTKVSNMEIKTAGEYLSRMKRSMVISPDFSESYWLSGHLIFKGKGKNPTEGAPILVGKQVKKAVDELIEHTREIRKETGSKHLFIGRTKQPQMPYGIRTYSSLLQDRDKLVKLGMPFVKFHQFRATFATILYDLKVPIGMIEKYLNHVRSDVTAGYIASEQERSLELMNTVLSGNISGASNDENYSEFEKALKSTAITPEFAGMSFGSQASFFQRLLKKYDIKINFSDHGHCVLPSEEICPHGYEEVSPCHTSGCEKFKPDTNEKPFFVRLLSARREQRKDIERFARDHGTAQVNFQRFDEDIKSISDIIKLIEKAS